MKTLYSLHFQRNQTKKQILNIDDLPDWCSHPLKYSKENVLYSNDEFDILQQYLNFKPFFIDVVEINSYKNLKCQFRIHGRQAFMFFMLDGNLKFVDVADRLIAHTLEKCFLMSYYDEGIYNMEVSNGKTLALIITIDPEWLKKVTAEYNHIYRFMAEFDDKSIPYLAMYQGKIEKNVRRWLHKVYHGQLQDVGLFDALLRENMTHLLKHYNNLLEGFWLAFDIRRYILDNVTDENLGIDMLCEYFKLSKRALSYMFKQAFTVSIVTYINNRRQEFAENLMREQGLTVSQVYMLVGYKDEGTFRYHYNRYRNKST